MYPRNGKTAIAIYQPAIYQPAARDHSLLLLLIAILLIVTAFSSNSHAEQNNTTATVSSPFYKQLQRSGKDHYRPAQNSLLQQVMAPNLIFNASPTDPTQDNELAFNYLWMQQYQEGYGYKGGGAAMGKLLRMGVKNFYKSYTGSNAITGIGADDDIASRFSDLDYRLRLSSDRVKLGIEYEF
ncbi:MAG: hypothetical protein V3T17_15940 [Pseudomonadales bacterium]